MTKPATVPDTTALAIQHAKREVDAAVDILCVDVCDICERTVAALTGAFTPPMRAVILSRVEDTLVDYVDAKLCAL